MILISKGDLFEKAFSSVSWIPEGCSLGWGLAARRTGSSVPNLLADPQLPELLDSEQLSLFDLGKAIWNSSSEKFFKEYACKINEVFWSTWRREQQQC